jgi:hypothetical protein
MGMFDQDLGKPFNEHYKEGDVFILQNIEVGPVINTKHGPGQVAFLTIDDERYSLFGEGVVNQARQMSPGDLPAEVVLTSQPTRDGLRRVKLLVPADGFLTATGASDIASEVDPVTGR